MGQSYERAFEQFIRKNGQRAAHFLSSRYSALSGEDIQDVLQDSYIALHKNIVDGKVSGFLYPYFLRICMNLAIKELRKQNTHIVVGINETDISQKDQVSLRQVDSILQASADDRDAIDRKKELVHQALDNMATRCRELLQSFYAEELSWSVIADLLGLKNADTAKSAASRCRRTFKEKYNQLKRRSYGN